MSLGSASVSAVTTITVGTWYSPESFMDQYGAPFREFEATHPDIKIEIMTVGKWGEFASKSMFLAATGDEHLPDILQVPPEQAAPLVVNGVLEDLEPWIQRTDGLGLDKWFPTARDAVRFRGKTIGMPAYVVNSTYAYNKGILAERGVEPPAPDEWVTWDKVRQIAKKTTVDKDADGTPEIMGYLQGFTLDFFLPAIWQAGGRLYAENGLVDVNSSPVYDAVNWLMTMTYDDGVHQPKHRSDFYTGKVATARFESWELNAAIDQGLDMGMASGIQGKVKTDILYVTPWSMTAGSKHKDEAWELLQTLTSPSAQAHMAQIGLVPMRRDVTLPDRTAEQLQGFIRNLEFARGYPLHTESAYVMQTFNEAMKPVWDQEKPVKPVLEDLQRTLNAELKRRLNLN